MANLSDSEEEQFFDTPQDMPDDVYEFWTQIPESVHDRRGRFFEQIDLRLNENLIEKEEAIEKITCDEINNDIERINLDSEAVLSNSSSGYSLFSHRSSLSCSSTEDDVFSDFSFENKLVNKFRDSDITTELSAEGVGKNSIFSKLREVGSKKMVKIDKFQKSGKNNMNIWLKKLRKKVNNIDSEGEGSSKLRITRVCTHKKRLKELSSLYEEQDFRAHEGLILAMKFSPNGRLLASGGEDGIVRVWKVIEVERENELDTESIDPSCSYFSINNCSELVALDTGKENNKKTMKPGCVIFPHKVFRIDEDPLHEFRGHCGEVLALSWSSNECLLSSSVDNTVRFWQVGNKECLKVFPHNNYVTCVEFNPVNNNYFISGSIDGKIRIWEVSNCRVVDWADIRDIVTALSYYPDGKRAIVGSMDGSCRFYDIIDNQLQLDTQIFHSGKKKVPSKRITGFQFCPSNSSKVLVSSADSQIRVLSGSGVIFKLKAPRMSSSHVIASFTEDGKHIISSSQDSNIHLWDYSNSKSIGSRESFVSKNVCVAIPWHGLKTNAMSFPPGNDPLSSVLRNDIPCENDSFDPIPSSSTDCFSLGRGIFPEDSNVSTQMGSCHLWGLVIMTAGSDGRIRMYRNYGLPVHL